MSPAKRRKEFVVIGLGRFGMSVVEKLIEEGQIVTAIDADVKKVEQVANKVSYSAVANSLDIESLRQVGVANADHVIVSTGDHNETTILTAANLLDLKIPEITVKSNNQQLSNILRKIGIRDIVHPEKESGFRTALRISHTQLIDFIDLDEDHAIVQFEIKEPSLTNIPLSQLRLRERYKINIIAIKRSGKIFIPSGDDVLQIKDILVVISKMDSITKFEEYLAGQVESKKGS